MEQISIKGIVVGAIIDWVTSVTFSMPVMFYVMFSRGLHRLPPGQVKGTLTAAMHDDVRIYAIQFVIGVACSVIGSYAAGALAKRSQILNGVSSAMLATVTGIYSLARGRYARPLWRVLVELFIATPLAGALGGYLALLQAQKSEVPA